MLGENTFLIRKEQCRQRFIARQIVGDRLFGKKLSHRKHKIPKDFIRINVEIDRLRVTLLEESYNRINDQLRNIPIYTVGKKPLGKFPSNNIWNDEFDVRKNSSRFFDSKFTNKERFFYEPTAFPYSKMDFKNKLGCRFKNFKRGVYKNSRVFTREFDRYRARLIVRKLDKLQRKLYLEYFNSVLESKFPEVENMYTILDSLTFQSLGLGNAKLLEELFSFINRVSRDIVSTVLSIVTEIVEFLGLCETLLELGKANIWAFYSCFFNPLQHERNLLFLDYSDAEKYFESLSIETRR